MAYSKKLRAKEGGQKEMGSPLHQYSTRIELIHDHNIAVLNMISGCLWSAIPDSTQAHTKGEGHRCYHEGCSIHRNGGTHIVDHRSYHHQYQGVDFRTSMDKARPRCGISFYLGTLQSGMRRDKCRIAGRNW